MGAAAAGQLEERLAAFSGTARGMVVQHGPEVARLLLDRGMAQKELAKLLAACHELFAWPAAADGRLPPRLNEVVQLAGMPAAVRCFLAHPDAARAASFAGAIGALAPGGMGTDPDKFVLDRSQLAAVLQKNPAAAELLCRPGSALAQRLASLAQRYGQYRSDLDQPGAIGKRKTGQAVLAGALKSDWRLLTTPWDHLLALEEVLQQGIGQQPSDGRRLAAYCIMYQVGMGALGCGLRCGRVHGRQAAHLYKPLPLCRKGGEVRSAHAAERLMQPHSRAYRHRPCRHTCCARRVTPTSRPSC